MSEVGKKGHEAVAQFRTDELFDTDRYPVNRTGSAAYKLMLDAARQGLEAWNCAQLADFIRPDVLAGMKAEAAALAPGAIYTKGDFNPYFSTPPAGTPEDHPLRRVYPRHHGMIRGDRFARDGAISLFLYK